jgi:hypothetical protein
MVGRVQTLRSSVAGNRPTGRQPGELYVNWPDAQLGVINAASATMDLLAVRMFSTTTSYVVGDHVLYNGALYQAIAPSAVGAFVPANWSRMALLSDLSTVVNPNRFDNGDMWVDQHYSGASVVVPAATQVPCPDRWWTFNTLQRLTIGQNYAITTKAPNFQYFYGAQVTAAGAAPLAAANNVLQQNIEFDSFNDFAWGTVNAQPATLSFWVYSSVAGLYGISLTGSYRAFITTYTIPVANTWTKITIAVPADTLVSSTNWAGTGNLVGLNLNVDLGVGANGQTGTSLGAWQNYGSAYVPSGTVKLVATTGAQFGITGVKLELGSSATPYPMEDLARRLARCQRYYFNTGILAWGYGAAAGYVFGSFSLPTTMRAAPTLTFISPSYSNASAVALNATDGRYVNIQATITALGAAFVTGRAGISAEI